MASFQKRIRAMTSKEILEEGDFSLASISNFKLKFLLKKTDKLEEVHADVYRDTDTHKYCCFVFTARLSYDLLSDQVN